MKARWLAPLAIAGVLMIAGTPQSRAQQAPVVTGTRLPGFRVGDPGFGVAGFRNFGGGTFFPNLGVPLRLNGFGVRPFPFFGGVAAPQGAGLTPMTATPFAPDFRQPQSGVINPLGGVPFGAVPAGVAGGASFSAFGPNAFGANPAVPGAVVPIVPGDPRASLSGGLNPSAARPSLSGAFNPAVASPFIPNTQVPQSGAFGVVGQAPIAAAEQRALLAAQRVMSNTALTEGIVTAVDPTGVRVRLAANGRAMVGAFPLGQVFFFDPAGQMLTAAAGSGQIVPGTRVLVPVNAALGR